MTLTYFELKKMVSYKFRLDFEQFNIRGPETLNNLCTYDQFIVSGGNPVPPICGNNNGNHSKWAIKYQILI